MIRRLLLRTIKWYQYVASPDTGIFSQGRSACRFDPTCSDYMYQSIETYGVLKGVVKGGIRILKCHPWHKGGHDPVQKKGLTLDREKPSGTEN